ncbi:MAG: tetratricopeptide repeat protein [Candidatus Hydrogenedentes bacterium]|nr:tetratricopeptide repeat protein [Candidatus Hydrogenedentota bacterium]
MLARWRLYVILVAVLAGCATGKQDSSKYSKDAVTYGSTEGLFRGRWWNYYERGRSFQDGEFWKEAEQDFRTALGGRARDQLWPRTYGLHFVREFFPHRELGIALYHQGRTQEAISELEISVNQQYSARAGYFLNEARQTWLKSANVDTALPTVEIIAPVSTSPVAAIATTLEGVARDDTYVGKILIDGEVYPLRVSAREVSFSKEVTLRPGANEFHLAVEDLLGKRTESTFIVRSDVDGPVLSFDPPVVVPGTVKGVVYDPGGVTSLKMAGNTATLLPGAQGQFAFSIELPREGLTPPVAYEAEDTFKNVTRGILPVDAVKVSQMLPMVVFARGDRPVIPIFDRLVGLVRGPRIVAVAAATEPAPEVPVRIDIPNVEDGQTYFMDQIVVGLDVAANSAIQGVQLNGTKIETIPDRQTQKVSRKISLAPGTNEIKAAAQDVQGLVGEKKIAVERQETEVEGPKGRLRIVILGNVWQKSSPKLEGEAQTIVSVLDEQLDGLKRFARADRSLMPEILTEQQLSAALASKEGRLALGNLQAAEVIFIGSAHRDSETLEIIVEVYSTETSLRVARADVAGPANDLVELRNLVELLALRIAQEIPRVEGLVAKFSAPATVYSTLTENLGIHESMKCIVFRTGEEIRHPKTNEVIGHETQVLAEALVDGVGTDMTTANVVSWLVTEDQASLKPGDEIVTK